MRSAANPDAVRAWNGPDGEYWARRHDEFDAAMRGYQDRFMVGAAICADDRVLDIGCGNGQTSCAAAQRATRGSVLGLDLSALMLERARSRAAALGLPNVGFVQADAQVEAFAPASFDVAISRTGTMFFQDPAAAFTNIGRALRPGGRLVMLVWQSARRNAWFTGVADALGLDLPDPPSGVPGPFSLADPTYVGDLLAATGFTGVGCESIVAPMYFGDSVAHAAQFIGGLGFVAGALRAMSLDAANAAWARLNADIIAHLGNSGVEYPSAAWLVTAERKAS